MELDLLQSINSILDRYQSGDLIAIVEIKDKLKNLEELIKEREELKDIVTNMINISDIIAKDSSKEDKIITLIKNIIKLFIAFFSKNIESKDFYENIESNVTLINEILKEKDEILEKNKKRELYPDGYFDSIVDDKKLLEQFYVESIEHLDEAQSTLIELEFDTSNKEIINNTFRNFHTIKGSSSFLGLKNIEEISHNIESLFDLVRKGKIVITKELIDVIFFGIQLIKNILDIMNTNEFSKEEMKKSFSLIDIFPYINLMKRILNEYQIKKIGEILAEEGKLSLQKLEEVLNLQKEKNKKFGEILIEEKVVPAEDVAEALKKQEAQKNRSKRIGYVKVSNERLNTLIDIVGELVITESMLKDEIIANRSKLNISDRTISELENITKTIKNLVLSMGMLPISEIFNKLKVVARNTANELGKTVVVDIEGGETELDRNVMEAIYDPLMHIVRNAIDHGIELPEEREKAGKNRIGKITLKAEHKGSGIEIIVTDDGKGIDKEKIINKALSMKLIEKESITQLSEKDIYNLLFLPGFSTSEKVTNVSGRGVGLDVVKKNLDSIHGRVEIKTEVGKGSSFIIKLPLTLAIIEGFVTTVDNNKYVFPFNIIDEIVVIEKSKIITQQNSNEAIIFQRGIHIPVIFLKTILKKEIESKDSYLGIIINFDQYKYCIIVDTIIGKQEIVVKNLGKSLNNYKFFSGGTIFGDGSIGFVVDIQGLIETVVSE